MANLIQMTIISTTKDKNPLEEMNNPLNQQESERKFLSAVSKTTE